MRETIVASRGTNLATYPKTGWLLFGSTFVFLHFGILLVMIGFCTLSFLPAVSDDDGVLLHHFLCLVYHVFGTISSLVSWSNLWDSGCFFSRWVVDMLRSALGCTTKKEPCLNCGREDQIHAKMEERQRAAWMFSNFVPVELSYL